MYSGIFKFLCFKFKCKENKNCSKSMLHYAFLGGVGADNANGCALGKVKIEV